MSRRSDGSGPSAARAALVAAGILGIVMAGCAVPSSEGFKTWLAGRDLSVRGDARQGPDALFVPDVSAEELEAGWPRPAAWRRAAATRFIFLDGSGDRPEAPTTARLLTSGGVLFARFDCRDDDADRLVCTSLGRDAAHLWRDDCVRLVLWPEVPTGVGLGNIIVNPVGGLADSAGPPGAEPDVSWDPPVRRRCRIDKTGWTAELAVPLRAFVPVGVVPRVWRGNLARSRAGREGIAAEDTGWRATGTLRPDVPERLGWLYFEAVEKGTPMPGLDAFQPRGRDLLAELKDPEKLCRILRGRFGRPAAIAAPEGAGSVPPEARLELTTLGEPTQLELQRTTASVHQGRGEIIVRVRCQESDIKSIAATPKPTAISREDNVGIWLAPWRKESADYLQVLVNAAGAVRLRRGQRDAAVGDVKATVKLGQDAWTAEVRVPLSLFGISAGRVPALWGLNVTRNRPSRPGTGGQGYAWSPFVWSAHRPSEFGTLWLPKADVFPDLGPPAELERLARAGSAGAAGSAPPLPPTVAKFNWTVLTPERARQIQAPAMTYNYLGSLRDQQYASRDRTLAKIKSWDDWLKWRREVLANIEHVVGRFPDEVGPLNPRVSVAFENEHIHIERLVYESRPKFYVTANVYVPKGGRKGEKFPAIVRVVGHWTTGRLGRSVVSECVDLALSGYFVLALDFTGHGERIYTNHGHGSHEPTRNHYAIGAPCLLTGAYLANYFVHDVRRGLDYLATRPEVDMKRVVMTGSSGGGTLTSYVAAIDERITAAAPVSSLGCTRRAGGNYDSEQVLYDYVRGLMDPEGRCALAAPRPLTVIREVRSEEINRRNLAAFERARRIYRLKGRGRLLTYVPTKYSHGYNEDHYRLFRKWLDEVMPPNHPGRPRPPTPKFSYDCLRATKTWRVYYTRELADRRTVWSDNASQIDLSLAFDAAVNNAEKARQRAGQIARVLRKLLCLRSPQGPPEAELVEKSAVAGYPAEKLLLKTDPGVFVPAVLLRPKGVSSAAPAVVWLEGRGKTAAVLHRWMSIRKLLDAGVAVLLPDVRATGETSPGGAPTFHGPETCLNGFSFRIGVPLIGMRVRDVLCCVRYLQSRGDIDKARVGLLGDSLSETNPPRIRHRRLLIDPGLEPLHTADSLGPALAILAFALDEGIAACATNGALASYASICRESHFYHQVKCFVPCILRHCDIEDICASAAPRPLMLAGSVNGLNQRLDEVGQARSAFRNTRRGYRLLRASEKLLIDPDGGAAESAEFLAGQLGAR